MDVANKYGFKLNKDIFYAQKYPSQINPNLKESKSNVRDNEDIISISDEAKILISEK